jgi:enoyl-[acyl-carrier protein] reductase II
MENICELLGIEYPIIQGAMAWIADASLASAVSNAGGLGIVACGNADADWVRGEIRKTKELTKKPFGVNVMLLNPNADAIMDVICEEGVAVVTTGAGNPGKYIPKLKERGIKVIPVVASVALAIRVARVGADAIIAEGLESGGHIGEATTMALVPQVADAVKVPVIAAGGIGDGRGIAAAFMLGARGVQIGTRFLVAKECTVAQNYKDMILKAKDSDTVATGRSTGHPVRVLKNKLARDILSMEKRCVDPSEIEKLGTGALRAAVKDGDVANGSVMSGQIAGMISKEQTAKEMIEEMMEEAAVIYENRATICGARGTILRNG